MGSRGHGATNGWEERLGERFSVSFIVTVESQQKLGDRPSPQLSGEQQGH